jgi:aryl-alcohol dehydrogenase-like predicted oxidoreductase
VEEIMRGLDDLVRQGKVLYVGISDAPAWWIAQANTLAHLRGWSPFIGLQIESSLIERSVERELIPMAKALNLGLTAWSPLAGGLLTGRYHGHASPEQGRMNSEMMKELCRSDSGRTASSRPSKLCPLRPAAAWRRSRWPGFATAPCRSSPSSARESFLS